MEKEIKDTKKINSLVSSKTSNFWIKKRNQRALDLFHQAAERVPAYKKFLARHKINPEKIQTWNDFQTVPIINKKNYLRYYPYHELFWDGNPAKDSTYTSTTGSTGEPFYFPREKKLDWQGSLIHERFLNGFSDDKTSTLVIVAFGMGVWIGGLITYSGYEITRDRSKKKFLAPLKNFLHYLIKQLFVAIHHLLKMSLTKLLQTASILKN
jgi:phenylacetate-coenzyme A ligase PaaK-like adenylate-forming protein